MEEIWEAQEEEIVFEAISTMVNPRIGGGTDSDTWWTGGPNIVKIDKPKSSNARRPNDLKSLSKVQESCEQGLPESRQLGTEDDKDSNITVSSWINEIRSNLEKKGMDTVFHVVLDTLPSSEKFLLTDWGDLTMVEVREWVDQLKVGVLKDDGTRLSVCQFDLDNLDWSAQMLKNSITVRLWEEIESDLEYGATGPEIFVAIMSRFQHSSTSAARALVSKLQGMKLVKEPGMNVDTFSKKVSDLVQQILGNHKRSIPEDLTCLVAQCFLDTDVDEFKMAASAIFNKVDRNPNSMTWRAIITDLKDKYRSLVGLNRWPHKNKKTSTDELSALKGTINMLTQKVDNLRSGQNQAEKSKRKCFNCGAEDHIKKDCPKPVSNNNNSGNSGSGGGKNSGKKHWTKVKPNEGQPHKKTVNNAEYLWCDKCGHWRTGDKKHLTVDHKTKAELQAASNTTNPPARAMGGNATPAIVGLGNLQMMQGLFTGKVCLPVDETLN